MLQLSEEAAMLLAKQIHFWW